MVSLHLGYNEQEKEAQKHLALHQMFAQDPTLQPLYSLENRYNMMKKVLEAQGIKNVDAYLTSPDQIPPAQPDPAQEMQMAMAQKQLELQERQTAVAEQKAAIDAQNAQARFELDMQKAQSQFALQSDQQDLKEEQHAHKVKIDEGELEILKRTEDVRGIASPTG